MAEFIASFGSKIKLYLALHSYGQYVLFPRGHTVENISDYKIVVRILSS